MSKTNNLSFRHAISVYKVKKTLSISNGNISPMHRHRKPISKARKIFKYTLLVAFFISLIFIPTENVLSAAGLSGTDIEYDITNNVNNTLGGIDFGNLDNIVGNLGSGTLNLFGTNNFGAQVRQILNGDFASNYPNLFVAMLALFGGVILDVLPILTLIIGITILSGFIQTLRHESGEGGVKDIIHFVTYAAVVVITMTMVTSIVLSVGNALTSMTNQMNIIFPILLSLMVAVGGTVSAGVYKPAVAILSNGVMQIFTLVIMPIFIITLVFSVVGHLSPNTRLDKFVSFFTSLYKWLIGIIFTMFLGFLAIQGITAGAHDGLSIRAARMTISSSVPILGGYISQGFDLVMASSVLIKNAIGLAGLYLLIGAVFAPVVKIVVFSLGLKLAAAITQPIADDRISNFLTTINKSFSMLASVLIGAAFMYFITIGLVIMTGNSLF
ncbi:MAG: stage III sporulation protein AE [Firmicutes bacterium]|nr:stage III sporulation protein AE [Bacillota bacterium]